ncbi:hypothetical protein J4E85_003130 [Alternaria conjuncta]|uniref:uncharacterized protein n=1 Tax=Alternaria viburni TaxID=566460 RepID=UPI0020C510E7|nr:uncharacterized protein J4E79_008327 [Alternaria viburni]XP_051328560.1 uncharacterized protein J4E85_003130 [Alternaria conjuncta]KAI4655260.1 hypothetical protein J4E79_008327 [Alternaria viburni]KAI4932730.1 hypothetical protein J4E85_003130 [Alternaria conjuncta]
MSPSESNRSLSPIGQMYRNEYLRAVNIWKSSSRDEAYIIVGIFLLTQPLANGTKMASIFSLATQTIRARDLYDEMSKETLRIDPNKDVAGLTQYLEMAEVMLAQPLLKPMAR